MLEINAYGSLEDRRQSLTGGGAASEEKLRERLADAMVDLNGDVNHKTAAMMAATGNTTATATGGVAPTAPLVGGAVTSPCMPVRTVTGKLTTLFILLIRTACKGFYCVQQRNIILCIHALRM